MINEKLGTLSGIIEESSNDRIFAYVRGSLGQYCDKVTCLGSYEIRHIPTLEGHPQIIYGEIYHAGNSTVLAKIRRGNKSFLEIRVESQSEREKRTILRDLEKNFTHYDRLFNSVTVVKDERTRQDLNL